MFSFSSLAVFSTVAFSALTSALPLSGLPVDLPVDPSAVTGVVSGLPVVGSVAGGIAGRADAQQSIAVILTGVTAKLAPATQALRKFVLCSLRWGC